MKKQVTQNKNKVVRARITEEEMKIVLAKAATHSGGQLSEYVRLACVNYKPRGGK